VKIKICSTACSWPAWWKKFKSSSSWYTV